MLYQLLIYPIELIIDFAFYAFDVFLPSKGFAIMGVSIAVTLLSLPLYVIAEKWQQIERDTQKMLKPRADRIKKAFKGDEQYMMLSTFYKQNHYHPLYALRSSISLLIQVPFFIAAYHYLSNLESIKGLSFWFIKDLGNPDALFSIGNFNVNILPIAMTLINIIAGAVYTKGFPAKEKIQINAMAVLFLIILYDSPSGLVLYWTMNNVLSLVKNIFYKLKNPIKALYITILSCVVIVLIYTITRKALMSRIGLLICATLIILAVPLLIKLINWVYEKFLKGLEADQKTCNLIFIFTSISLSLLCGCVTSSSLIATSPLEFSFIDEVASPLTFIKINFLQSFGLFFVWAGAFYVLFSKKSKTIISFLFSIFCILAVLNNFFLIKDLGKISATLVFDSGFRRIPQIKTVIIDFVIAAAVTCGTTVLIKYNPKKIILPLFQILTAVFVIMSGVNLIKINKVYKEYAARNDNTTSENLETEFSLSKTEKNVVIIMLDRAINDFFPYIINERPDVAEALDGFTYYPDTLSFAANTCLASPGFIGGWEYTPEEINKRDSETLIKKHNEALTVLPRIFSENGYQTTVTDMPWANYSWIPDNSIYKDYPDINAINIEAKYTSKWAADHDIELDKESSVIKTNLFKFALLKIAPDTLRGFLFDNGRYCSAASTSIHSLLKMYIDRYSALDYMPAITDFNSKKPTFFFITNNYTHDIILAQYPDYVITNNITNIGPNPFTDNESNSSIDIYGSYHANIGSFIALSRWFKTLKENGVWDNTRIIIASDHGGSLATGNLPKLENFNTLTSELNPLLLVKDFNSKGEIKTDESFMCNADCPYIAVKDLIENPVNPFTGKKITEHDKSQGITVYYSSKFNPEQHKTNTFILDQGTFIVKDDMRIAENWKKVK